MARTLESLDPGTPVFAGSAHVGDVRAVYAQGDARSAELVVIRLNGREDDVSIPATEIESVDERGVHLMRTEPDQLHDVAPFDESHYTTLKKLK